MQDALSRRRFVLSSASGISAAWVAAHWPAILAAADHAHRAVQAVSPPKLAVLTTEQATEIEAIASQIIPTDDTPGAREAGVIYFIDRALKTFASSQNGAVVDAIAQVQEKTKELFPVVTKFSAASSEQQIAVLRAMENTRAFGLFRFHTVCGFLAAPSRGGNRNEIGWKLIGFDSSHTFQPPFGYYDKDYPGWQPNPSGGNKK